MIVKLVNTEMGYIENQTHQQIVFGLHGEMNLILINQTHLNNDELFFNRVECKDGLLAILNYSNKEYFLHVKNNQLILTRFINGCSKGSINFDFEFYTDRYKLEKSKYNYVLIDTVSNSCFILDSRFFKIKHTPILSEPIRAQDEKNIYLKIEYTNFYGFVEYTIAKNNISLKTSNYSNFKNNNLKLKFHTANQFELITKSATQRLKISDIKNKKNIKLNLSFKDTLKFPTYVRLGKIFYVLTEDKNDKNIYIKWDKRVNLMLKSAEYKITNKKDYFKLIGKVEFNENPFPNQIMTNYGKVLSDIIWKSETEFFAKIKITDIKKFTQIHNTLHFAKNNENLLPVKRYNKEESLPNKRIYSTVTFKDKVFIARLNLADNMAISILPYLPVYEKKHQRKINIAYYFVKYFKVFLPKKLNLYFEKEASRVGESGSYIFEEVMKDPTIGKHNYFILDKNSPDYKNMKNKWNNSIIERFSFKHYLYIFLATNFVSSELSNHVISARLFNDKLNYKIKHTPLYFLQHGIMFAKPVDNPMAAGFHKKNLQINVVKNVISSDLEAGEFYKMGYDDSDLMKTGLPKLDGAYLNSDADRITYMPTWRYWEEVEILNGNFKNTTYFDSLMKVIGAFENAGIIHLLQITPHNKFAEFITETLPEYSDIICTDPTEALKNSKVFITDYSSIIYDAIFRGAYPIFYWKEKEYLIENYKAFPPVDDQNAPGKVAYSEDELVEIVKNAIERNFIIEPENLEKYRQINEFYDRKNSSRVLKVLKEENIF